MIEIEIGGRKWPMRATIGAWKKFGETTGKSLAQLMGDDVDVEHICVLAFFFIEAGCKANGTTFEMSVDEFLDSVEIGEMEMVANTIAAVMQTAKDNQKKRMTKRP